MSAELSKVQTLSLYIYIFFLAEDLVFVFSIFLKLKIYCLK